MKKAPGENGTYPDTPLEEDDPVAHGPLGRPAVAGGVALEYRLSELVGIEPADDLELLGSRRARYRDVLGLRQGKTGVVLYLLERHARMQRANSNRVLRPAKIQHRQVGHDQAQIQARR